MHRLYRYVFPHKVVRIEDNGVGNVVDVDKSLTGGKLRVVLNGSHNTVHIGNGCKFYRNNTIFIVGGNNQVSIGRNTTFDGNVLLVPGEGIDISMARIACLRLMLAFALPTSIQFIMRMDPGLTMRRI